MAAENEKKGDLPMTSALNPYPVIHGGAGVTVPVVTVVASPTPSYSSPSPRAQAQRLRSLDMAPLNAMSVSELESWQNNYNAQRRARITGTGLWARWRRWRMPTWLKVLLVLALMAGLVVIVYYVAIALCAITPKIRKGLGLDEHGRVKGKGKGPGGSYLNN